MRKNNWMFKRLNKATFVDDGVIKSKTWLDIFKKYNPDITDKEVDYILWNETCYPFDDVTTIKQIEEYYNK